MYVGGGGWGCVLCVCIHVRVNRVNPVYTVYNTTDMPTVSFLPLPSASCEAERLTRVKHTIRSRSPRRQ